MFHIFQTRILDFTHTKYKCTWQQLFPMYKTAHTTFILQYFKMSANRFETLQLVSRRTEKR